MSDLYVEGTADRVTEIHQPAKGLHPAVPLVLGLDLQLQRARGELEAEADSRGVWQSGSALEQDGQGTPDTGTECLVTQRHPRGQHWPLQTHRWAAHPPGPRRKADT